jgi:anion transporter
MTPAVESLIIVALLAIAYALDKLPAAVVAITAAILCASLKMIPYAGAFASLAGTAAVLLMSMMIVGGALFHTGLAARIARAFLKLTGTSERGVMVAIMLVAALLSSVLNNVGVVVTLMPIVLKMCQDAKISPSRGLMPLAYGAGVGGAITLVGTASTVTANGLLEAAKIPSINFIELAWIGIPLTVLSIVYMAVWGRKLIPDTGSSFEGLAVYNEKDDSQKSGKQVICGIIFVIILICMAWQPFKLPLYFISSVGALILVLTGCISEKEAYATIDWPTIVICGAMIAVGNAVTATGGGKLIANWVVSVLGSDASPYLITAVLVIVVTVMTQFLSNVSTATLMTPIAIAIASGIGCNAKTLGIIVALAANGSFLTPVGAQAFTVVYEPGKFKFADFTKVGLPIVLINTILAIVLVPIIWPF